MLLPGKTYAFTNHPVNRRRLPCVLNNFNYQIGDLHRQAFVIIIQVLQVINLHVQTGIFINGAAEPNGTTYLSQLGRGQKSLLNPWRMGITPTPTQVTIVVRQMTNPWRMGINPTPTQAKVACFPPGCTCQFSFSRKGAKDAKRYSQPRRGSTSECNPTAGCGQTPNAK